jgi:hypothetical protein
MKPPNSKDAMMARLPTVLAAASDDVAAPIIIAIVAAAMLAHTKITAHQAGTHGHTPYTVPNMQVD